ncbi:hypothetical protein ABXS75_08175 [Roseburia hominis]
MSKKDPGVIPKDIKPKKAAVNTEGSRKYIYFHMVRHVFLRIWRQKLKTLLTIAVTLAFIMTLSYMEGSIEENLHLVDNLYRTTTVEARIVKKNPTIDREEGNIISPDIVSAFRNNEFVKEIRRESAGCQMSAFFPSNDERKLEEYLRINTDEKGFGFYGIDDPEWFLKRTGDGSQITYGEGWTAKLFAEEWKGNLAVEETSVDLNSSPAFENSDQKTKRNVKLIKQPVSVIISDTLAEHQSLLINDKFYTLDTRGSGLMTECVVAGYYKGISVEDISEPILIPVSALEEMNQLLGYGTSYSSVKFAIDPSKNREIEQFEEEASRILLRAEAGSVDLTIFVYDEELRKVVQPLDESIRLMERLIPLTFVISLVTAAGLSIVFLLQNKKEAAIMRCFAMNKRKTIFFFGAEQMFTVLLGLAIGSVLLAVRMGDVLSASKGLVFAAAYFVSSIAGAVLGGMICTSYDIGNLLRTVD